MPNKNTLHGTATIAWCAVQAYVYIFLEFKTFQHDYNFYHLKFKQFFFS